MESKEFALSKENINIIKDTVNSIFVFNDKYESLYDKKTKIIEINNTPVKLTIRDVKGDEYVNIYTFDISSDEFSFQFIAGFYVDKLQLKCELKQLRQMKHINELVKKNLEKKTVIKLASYVETYMQLDEPTIRMTNDYIHFFNYVLGHKFIKASYIGHHEPIYQKLRNNVYDCDLKLCHSTGYYCSEIPLKIKRIIKTDMTNVICITGSIINVILEVIQDKINTYLK